MKPAEAALPAEECEGASGEEPHREGRPRHQEAELPAVRHDHAPRHRRIHQEGRARVMDYLFVSLSGALVEG